jgi:hypothetical protein
VIEMSCPVMKCEASLTKKTRTGAKSRAGSPNCPPSGSRAAMLALVESSDLLGRKSLPMLLVHGGLHGGKNRVRRDSIFAPL